MIRQRVVDYTLWYTNGIIVYEPRTVCKVIYLVLLIFFFFQTTKIH